MKNGIVINRYAAKHIPELIKPQITQIDKYILTKVQTKKNTRATESLYSATCRNLTRNSKLASRTTLLSIFPK